MSAMTAARPGLEALLEGLFDYAGTFAPASLPLDEALRESASFKTTLRRPGMVAADIVLPARELASLGERVRGLRACALGSWDSLRVDASAAAAGAASLLSLEVRLPASGRPREAAAARDRLPSGARLFLEPDFSALESIETLADSLRAGDLGLKVRCV
ncbi:MAG TPA: hypothetical protein VNI01_01940, partial [Elusimicrobiota bacterium]|nr:hypothetical protein [Elusimicrobiota bacterium]